MLHTFIECLLFVRLKLLPARNKNRINKYSTLDHILRSPVPGPRGDGGLENSVIEQRRLTSYWPMFYESEVALFNQQTHLILARPKAKGRKSPALLASGSMAGAAGIELATPGFGDRCSAN